MRVYVYTYSKSIEHNTKLIQVFFNVFTVIKFSHVIHHVFGVVVDKKY